MLRNLDAIRDWGYAPEYVEGMWRMMQHERADDFVLATNTGYSVRDFLNFSFNAVNLDWEKHVKFDHRYIRPAEVDALIGNYSKAQENLGWVPETFAPKLASLMVAKE